MKYTSQILPLALGALLMSSPLSVFAYEDAYNPAVSVSATSSIEAQDDSRGRARYKADLLERAVQERREMPERLRAGLIGTSTKERMERFENSGKGVDPAKVQERAGDKIDNRIEKLQKQIARVAQMERLSAEQKASITAELTAQVTAITALKASIASETDPEKIKELKQSITKEYRVYAVTMPKAAITAASDRIMHIVAQMEGFATKLAERVTASGSAEASAALSDFTVKVADAKVQAQAAASLVAGLSADNGDTTIAASNTAALKSAKEKIDAAQADLKAARKDIGVILKAVKGTGEADS